MHLTLYTKLTLLLGTNPSVQLFVRSSVWYIHVPILVLVLNEFLLLILIYEQHCTYDVRGKIILCTHYKKACEVIRGEIINDQSDIISLHLQTKHTN